MKKRYQFIVDGKTYYKNVSPENEEKFLKKYSKYNPSLVSKTDEPGKSQGTGQSQNNQQQNTESKSEDGSSGLRNNRLFKALKASMLSSYNPVGRMMAATYLGAEAFGAVSRGAKDWAIFDEERRKEKEAWKDSEATYLANNPIETKSDKPLEYKVDENNKRLYYNPAQDKFEKEVDYNYDRSQGVRFKNDSYGKFFDNIAYGTSNALSSSQDGDYTAEFIDLMQKGNIENMTLEDAKRIKELMEEQAAKPRAAKTEKWINTFNKEENWVFGFLRATTEDPGATWEVGLTSIAGQVRANKSFELASLAQSVGGAQALYAIKTMKGGPGSRVMAVGAYLRGVMSTLGGGVETTSKFGELLKEEFGGEIPSEKELVEFFEDTDKWRKFRNKAILKGVTIALVDNIGGGIVQNSVYKTAKTGRKLTAAGKGLAGESITGGGGEALSQFVIGEEIEGADVGLEILGQGGQATVDVGTALSPGKYTINKGRKNEEVISFNKIEEILESATPEEIADMNIEIEGNDALSARVKQQEQKGIILSNIDSRVVDQDVREDIARKQIELLRKQSELKSKQQKGKSIGQDETKVDPALQEEIQELENDIAQSTANYIALTDKKAAQDIEARSQRIAEKVFKGNLEFAKKHSSIYGLEYKEMSQSDIREKYGDDAASNTTGFVDSETNELIINLDLAKQENDVEVGNHELLHGILRKALKEGKISTNLIEQLKTQIGEQWSAVEQRVKDGGYTDDYMAENPDEWITLTSDAIRAGEITYSESSFQPLMDAITPILRAFGFKKINFKDGKAVFDFLKEYNRSIHKGALSSGIVSETAGDVQIEGDIKTKRIDSKPAVDKLAIDPKTKKNYTQQEWDRVGANRAIEALKEQGLMDGLIAAKYKIKDVPPSFVDDVVGSTEFLNMINRFNRGKRGKVDENDSLFGYIQGQLRFRADDVFKEAGVGQVPKGTGTVEADARTTEGQPKTQLEDTDTSFEKIDNEEINLRDKQTYQTKPEVRERKSTFRTEIGITRKGRIFREVKKALRTAESIVNPKKFLKTFEKTVSDSLFDFMKVYFPDTNSMIKYREAILESIPVSTLVQMQKQLPEKIFVKSYGRLTNKTQISDFVYGRNESGKNPGKKKLLTDDILDDSDISKARRKAGVQVYERLKPTSTQWQNYLNATEKGKRQTAQRSGTKGNNRIKILEESAKAIGRDATPENLTTDFLENYIQEKGLQDVLTVDQVREEINKTIDRPADLKFKRKSKKAASETANAFGKVVEYTTRELTKTIYTLNPLIGSKERINSKKFIQESMDFLERAKITMPEFIEEIKIATTKSTRTTFSNVKFFKKIAGEYNKLIQKAIKRVMYSGKGKTLDRNIVAQSRDKKILVNVGSAVMGQEFLTGKNFAKYSNENKNKLISFIRKAKAHVDQFPKDIKFIASFIIDSQNNQDHIIRKGANIVALPIDKNSNVIYDQKVEQEHMLMASDVGKLILQAIKNNQVEELVLVLEEAYAQMALLESDNTLLQQSKLSSSITNEQESGFYTEIINRVLQGKIKGMKGLLSIVRYAMANINLNKYILIENGKTITENFGIDVENFNKLTPAQQERVVKIQNEGLIEYFKGNTTLEKVKADANATSRIKYKRTSSQIKNTYNAIEAFNKQAELIKKQNREIQADLEKRGYKFKRKGQTPSEMIEILKKDLEKRGYEFVDMNKKGMSTFDFDETLIIDGENFVVATNPITNETEEISSGEWPTRGPELQALGYEFNFDDFVNVRGGVDGPLLQKMKNQIKKYGSENVFVLTARPQTADIAIHEWLKSKGVNIPFKNITGLADSRGQAKADWMLEKFSEGYNDMYFVDDALPNVKAVKNVLDQLDIKSKVVQAKLKFKRIAPLDFNKILEQSKNVKASKVFSAQEARKIGVGKGKNIFKNFYVPPSAEDFKGLLYRFIGKGEQGNAHAAFFKEKLLDPFAKGSRDWNTYKQVMANDYKALKKQFKNIGKTLNNKVKGTVFTNDNAMRVYLWNKAGFEIPGISEKQIEKLVDHVENNAELKSFAEGLSVISRLSEGYIEPSDFWSVESIGSDLNNIVRKIGREQFFAEWIENKDTIFSPENLNKIEAIYGTNLRNQLENILYRMQTGQNRTTGKDAQVNKFLDWINGSVGAVMFFNMRSATLQTISMANFINMADNHPVAAAKAFANLPQYIKDFTYIFNSDMLKQRRAGLEIDVSANELTSAFKDGKSKPQAIIHYLLEKGFKPTQIADSFAIAAGGATFYRNRLNKLIKDGMSEAEAKKQAWLDFQEIAEETQQSSRPDLISNQQAGPLGRLILAWQNTPMQMTRLQKKKLSDLINRRRIPGYTQFQSDMANISGIAYYGLIQNIYFGALQTGLMFMLFGWDDDEDRKEKLEQRVANGALDSILRGTGIYGAAVSTLKNVLLKWREEREKPGWKRDNLNIAQELVNFSPPMGTKMRKIMSAIRTEQYNKGVSKEIGFRIENPNLSIATNWVEALTNAPVARLLNKANNIEEAITGNHQMWQRVALLSGWSQWSLGVVDEELEAAKDAAKKTRADENKKIKEQKKKDEKKKEEEEKKKKGIKTVRCSGTNSSGKRCGLTTETNKKTWKCFHHAAFKDGMDRDGDGIKEYRCTATTSSGKRCKNKTENKNKRCYAHQ